MEYEQLDVDGAFVIRPQRRVDERGHFARMWCRDELSRRGLVTEVAQINTGFSPRRGTLRGMHYQLPPHAEVKIATCTRGEAFDVVVDLRRGSPTYRRWAGVHLSPSDGRLVYVPEGCAHGYLTLADDTELVYLTSAFYAPEHACGVRHDDSAFDIAWPNSIEVISQADRGWPNFREDNAIELRRDRA